MRNVDSVHHPHPPKKKQKKKNNQVGERLGFKEGRQWLVTPNRF